MTRKFFSATRIAAAAMLAFSSVLTLATDVSSQERNRPRGQAGVFDFYVLSLSWSPTFCDTQRGGRNAQQCSAERDFGFIVHGLWPQYDRGYPEFCTTGEAGRVPNQLGEPLFDIMPSMGLIGHQWRKHGACSGLSQRDYLNAIRTAYDRVKMPAGLADPAKAQTTSAKAIEEAFIAANPGMQPQGVSVTCERDKLDEVRICMTKDFGFRTCPEVDRRSCSLSRVSVPPAQ